MVILLHSSKTMVVQKSPYTTTAPYYAAQAAELHRYIQQLRPADLQKSMHISAKLAAKVHQQAQEWHTQPPTPALYAFRGDIYSGLRAADFSPAHVDFAQQHLRILSGLYGILRPLDGIAPYRLEAAYRLPDPAYRDLYAYWHAHLAQAIPADQPIINVTSNEYAQLLLPFVPADHVVSPRFLTRPAAGNDPVFVVVHAKIARGAYARWLILRGHDSAAGLEAFDDLGYTYAPDISTPLQPTYICDAFGGIGLSQRIIKARAR